MAEKKPYRKSGNDDFNSRFKRPRKKICALCSDKKLVLDYKNADQMKRFINEKGKILPRRATGTCAKHQREINEVVKISRHIAIVPYAEI